MAIAPETISARAETAQEVLIRETAVRHGSVSPTLGGETVEPGFHKLSGDQFLLREPGFCCHYSKGRGVTVELTDPAARGALELYLAGTVHAAIASINGFYPVHASAVALNGRVFAFTGPSGGGKSTLAAALARCGMTLFSDDTLVIDPRTSPPMCVPGHKRMKLWPEGAALARAEPGPLVAPDYPKHFIDLVAADANAMLPLGALIVLDEGASPSFERLGGSDRLTCLEDDHYTVSLHEWAAGMNREARFAFRVRLAQAIDFHRFTRPFDPARFEDMLDFIAARLEGLAAS